MRLKVSVCRLLIVAFMLAAMSVPAWAGPPTTSYGYGYSDIDTRLAATNSSTRLSGAGYSSYATNTAGASLAFDWTKNDAIYSFHGHSASGGGGNSFGDGSWFFAQNGTTNWSNYTTEVQDLLFALFQGCYTANTSGTYGNLLDVSSGKGVDANLGFTGLIYFPTTGCTNCNHYGNWWADRFYYYATSGYTIVGSANAAASDYYAKYGTYDGYNAWSNRGDTILTPARFGS